MALSTDDIRKVAAVFARPEHSSNGTQAVRSAAVSIDSWIDSNQVSFVAALPQPFKANTSAAEKALLLVYVVMKRAGLL